MINECIHSYSGVEEDRRATTVLFMVVHKEYKRVTKKWQEYSEGIIT